MVLRQIVTGAMAFLLPSLLLSHQSGEAFYPSIEGWRISDSVRVFTAENLYSFIDGAADAYLMQDFDTLTVAYYTRGDTSVTAEIYRHRTEENAYGIYCQERTSAVEELPIGIEGYYAETVLNFVVGRTYVKLTSFTLGSREKEGLSTIAKAVAGTLDGTRNRPALFDCFPEEGQVRKSEKFVGRDFLGYTFFRRGYLVDYRIASTSFQIFLIQRDDSASCDSLLSAYTRRPAEAGIVNIRDPYWGNVMIERYGTTLIGLIGTIPKAAAAGLFDAVHTKIQHIRKSRHEK